MPTCPRCAAVALVLLFVAFSGCDTNNGGSGTLGDLADVYTLTELRFEPEAEALEDADLGARLIADGQSSLEIFADRDDFALLRTPETGRTDLEVRVLSNAVELTAVTAQDEDDLDELFLPRTFRLNFTSPRSSVLRAEPALFLTTVNLQAFDPDRYQGLTAVRGRLFIAFERP